MVGAFLTCWNKAHDIAFIRQPVKGKFHHPSFFLEDWARCCSAADMIAQARLARHRAHAPRHHARRDDVLLRPQRQPQRGVLRRLHLLPRQPTLTWTDDELGRAIFYHDRKLNESS